MKIIKATIAFIAFLLLSSANLIQAINYPQPLGYVNDLAQILTPEFRNQLENQLTRFETDTQSEIAVLTIPSLEGQTIEQYAVAIFDQWQIGKKNQDNGLLLLIAPNEREVRLEVGYGLEPIINDGRAGEIIRNQITPAFREQDYQKGIQDAVNQIQNYLQSSPDQPSDSQIDFSPVTSLIKLIFGVGAFIFLIALIPGPRFWYLAGFIGLLTGNYAFSSIWGGVIFALIGILALYARSKKPKGPKRGGSGPFNSYRPHHNFGGFGRSGSGFGGFGGGRSGGGGASGKW